jgi:hypothetical protein
MVFTGSLYQSGSIAVVGSVSASSFTGSLLGTASWANNAITSSNAATASSADNFTVRGTLTAQTIVAQTITSSTDFVTGSTKFGTLLSNTHQFTGSVSITGSLGINGVDYTSTSASFDTRILNNSASIASLSGSYLASSASFNTRILNNSSSIASLSGSYLASSASFDTRILNNSASIASLSGSYLASSASFDTRILNNSASIASLSGSYLASSASFDTRILNNSSSIASLSGSYLASSASFDTRITNTSSSIATLSSSFLAFSSSYNTGSFTGSFIGTLTGTASWANNAISSSYTVNATSASYALSSSYAVNSTFAQTASYVFQAVSASFATSASNAQTASYVLNAVSASFASNAGLLNGTSSAVFATTGSNTFIGTQIVTGSLFTTGSNTLVGNTILSGSVNISGSTIIDGATTFRNTSTTITGSLLVSGSTTQIGNNTLTGNTTLSGSIIISGSTGPGAATASVQIYGDIRQTGYHRFDPVTTNIDTSISASYIYVSGSTNDLYFSQNGNGYSNTTRLRWLEGNLYTGLLHGGIITAATGSTTYQISSGSGIIVNLNASLSDDPYPTIQYLNWPNLSASIAPLTASYQQAFVSIDSSGNIYQQGTPYAAGQFDTEINIGVVLFQNGSTINGVKTQPSTAYGFQQAQNIFNRAFGPLKLSGFTLAPSGSSTLGLVVGSGTAYAPGSNYTVDPNEPSYAVDNGTNISKIFRYRQSGSTWVYDTNGGPGYTTINPGQYSNNGVLTTVQPNDWSIQRVFWFPNSVVKAIVVYYGNQSYSTEAEAIANVNIESFVEAPNTAANAVYLGAIVIRGNGVLTVPADFTILPGGLFRQVGGSGGGGSIVTQTLSGLSDVAISGPTSGQALVYDTTAAKWENKSFISASISGNAATATTATTASNALTASSADNFLVRGTLTAQTIVAQTITSSTDFITGSTRFGSQLSNTHQFTGSVSITGSLAYTNIPLGTTETNIVVTDASGNFRYRTNLSLQGIQGTQGTQGIQGTQGTQGTQGIQGITGVQGIQGITGAQGIQGTQGITGAQGTQGTQGIQGIIGIQGAQGIQGITGAQGTQGAQGITGAQGIQGITGAQGAQGTQGITGTQGTQGIQGITGAQGTQGTQGITGAQGIQGITGAQGTQGTQGIQGITGAQGTQGITGAQGIQGITGAQGTQGTQGIQGITGAQGTQGITGAQGIQGITGAQGTQGITGAQGIQGITGAQGIQGTQGIQGIQGSAANSITNNVDNYVVTATGNSATPFNGEANLIFNGSSLGIGVSPTSALHVAGSARVTTTFTLDATLTDYASVASSIAGANNLFTQATGSYTSAFFKYTVTNSTNARSGEVMAIWNGGSVQFTDNSTLDIGSTTAVTASVSIVGSDVQFNIQTNTSGWSLKSLATFM